MEILLQFATSMLTGNYAAASERKYRFLMQTNLPYDFSFALYERTSNFSIKLGSRILRHLHKYLFDQLM